MKIGEGLVCIAIGLKALQEVCVRVSDVGWNDEISMHVCVLRIMCRCTVIALAHLCNDVSEYAIIVKSMCNILFGIGPHYFDGLRSKGVWRCEECAVIVLMHESAEACTSSGTNGRVRLCANLNL